ncbi:MAG: hypothetical protein L3J54_09690, partial [Draconibacterium sp.]|nr:hypothetical protein [Draconibacterium sp.]
MLAQNDVEQTTQQPAAPTMCGGPGGGGGRGGFGSFEQPEVTTTRPTFYFYDLNGKISYRPTEKDNLAISIYSGKDDLFEDSENIRTINSPHENFTSITISNTRDEN